IEIMNESGACNIEAKVQGTRTKPYNVNIEVHRDSNGIKINGFCTCPMAISCKHVVAALLKARTQGATISNTHSSGTVLPKTRQNSEIDTWLRKLKQTVNAEPKPESTVDESYVLLYLLDKIHQRNDGLKVELVLAKRLKAGGLGTPK